MRPSCRKQRIPFVTVTTRRKYATSSSWRLSHKERFKPLLIPTTHLSCIASRLYYCSMFKYVLIKFSISFKSVGRDSSVGIATRYELDGPGIQSL